MRVLLVVSTVGVKDWLSDVTGERIAGTINIYQSITSANYVQEHHILADDHGRAEEEGINVVR